MPSVSSSKNLNRPALAAGIGPLSRFFFLIPIVCQSNSAVISWLVPFGLINLAPYFVNVVWFKRLFRGFLRVMFCCIVLMDLFVKVLVVASVTVRVQSLVFLN